MLGKRGYTILRDIVREEQLMRLRSAVDRVTLKTASTCVRRICSHSQEVSAFAGDSLLFDLLPDGHELVRSILFDKTPESNWPVRWHQDLTIAVNAKREVEGYGPWSEKEGVPHVQPPLDLLEQMITIRVHLDNVSEENGPFRVVPGSHLNGVVPSGGIKRITESETEVCVCRAGDILLMSPLLIHSSRRSESPRQRRILHFEYAPIDALDSKLEWSESERGGLTRYGY